MGNKLSDYTGNRDNNFNLIRVLAALAVLLTHSFALSTGNVDAQPLRKSLGMTFGTMAVDVFFIVSGFLVTNSLLSRKNLLAFARARFLRIFPALAVAVLSTVVVLGFFFTTLSPGSFFHSSETHLYVLKNTTLLFGVRHSLPGVFTNTPFKTSVNGSLWTLPFEIRMYAILGVLWAVLFSARRLRAEFFSRAVVVLAVLSVFSHIIGHFLSEAEHNYLRLFSLFFSGAAFYVLRDRIVLSRKLFIVSLLVVLASLPERHLFFVTYHLLVAYIIMFLAYVPSGAVRKYNNVGDYSYGIYIYAYPVQQCIAALLPGVSVGAMLIISFCCTVALAAISWHGIERPALQLKDGYGYLLNKKTNVNATNV